MKSWLLVLLAACLAAPASAQAFDLAASYREALALLDAKDRVAAHKALFRAKMEASRGGRMGVDVALAHANAAELAICQGSFYDGIRDMERALRSLPTDAPRGLAARLRLRILVAGLWTGVLPAVASARTSQAEDMSRVLALRTTTKSDTASATDDPSAGAQLITGCALYQSASDYTLYDAGPVSVTMQLKARDRRTVEVLMSIKGNGKAFVASKLKPLQPDAPKLTSAEVLLDKGKSRDPNQLSFWAAYDEAEKTPDPALAVRKLRHVVDLAYRVGTLTDSQYYGYFALAKREAKLGPHDVAAQDATRALQNCRSAYGPIAPDCVGPFSLMSQQLMAAGRVRAAMSAYDAELKQAARYFGKTSSSYTQLAQDRREMAASIKP